MLVRPELLGEERHSDDMETHVSARGLSEPRPSRGSKSIKVLLR